ncbi:hypothetical protein [Bradyrhizobium sp. SRS-191]|uniref:hypothetical protein n=1 Tax=Bradyrhizobium sp. SRS-191 TaxID=2962606 RepID=UPI00211EEE37|nr:hypothetical protein [Bradyrhizobium sp. SRS-191]
MSKRRKETELLLISEAVSLLETGMYGSLGQPLAITEIKKHDRRLSVGLGARSEHAAQIVMKAMLKGKLAVYVQPHSPAEPEQPHLEVPLDLVKEMIPIRGVLPDYAVRPESLARKADTRELAAAILHSALYLRCDQFDAWYERSKKMGNWPTQHSSKKPRIGRPSKARELRDRTIGLVNGGEWSAQQDSIAALIRRLDLEGAISRQTVERMLEQLHRETGDRRYCTIPERTADTTWGSFEELVNTRRRESGEK